MSKLSPANVIAICTLIIGIIFGIASGIGGTVAWGSLKQQVKGNTGHIAIMQEGDRKLAEAVVELRIAVGKLTTEIKNHQPAAHEHGGE